MWWKAREASERVITDWCVKFLIEGLGLLWNPVGGLRFSPNLLELDAQFGLYVSLSIFLGRESTPFIRFLRSSVTQKCYCKSKLLRSTDEETQGLKRVIDFFKVCQSWNNHAGFQSDSTAFSPLFLSDSSRSHLCLWIISKILLRRMSH